MHEYGLRGAHDRKDLRTTRTGLPLRDDGPDLVNATSKRMGPTGSGMPTSPM